MINPLSVLNILTSICIAASGADINFPLDRMNYTCDNTNKEYTLTINNFNETSDAGIWEAAVSISGTFTNFSSFAVKKCSAKTTSTTPAAPTTTTITTSRIPITTTTWFTTTATTSPTSLTRTVFTTIMPPTTTTATSVTTTPTQPTTTITTTQTTSSAKTTSSTTKIVSSVTTSGVSSTVNDNTSGRDDTVVIIGVSSAVGFIVIVIVIIFVLVFWEKQKRKKHHQGYTKDYQSARFSKGYDHMFLGLQNNAYTSHRNTYIGQLKANPLYVGDAADQSHRSEYYRVQPRYLPYGKYPYTAHHTYPFGNDNINLRGHRRTPVYNTSYYPGYTRKHHHSYYSSAWSARRPLDDRNTAAADYSVYSVNWR